MALPLLTNGTISPLSPGARYYWFPRCQEAARCASWRSSAHPCLRPRVLAFSVSLFQLYRPPGATLAIMTGLWRASPQQNESAPATPRGVRYTPRLAGPAGPAGPSAGATHLC